MEYESILFLHTQFRCETELYCSVHVKIVALDIVRNAEQ